MPRTRPQMRLGTVSGAVIVGCGIAGLVPEISRFGISKVYLLDRPELANYVPENYARALSEARSPGTA